MSETEKLRSLLAEAREWVELNGEAGCPADQCEQCAAADKMLQRIDAALAEPVDDYDVDADLRLHKEDRLRLRAENLRLERERDEARAEVERLSTWGPLKRLHTEMEAEVKAAYQRGAEAMREAAALCAEREETQLPLHVASAIRALPIPEDK